MMTERIVRCAKVHRDSGTCGKVSLRGLGMEGHEAPAECPGGEQVAAYHAKQEQVPDC
jgi:hypothetical protein